MHAQIRRPRDSHRLMTGVVPLAEVWPKITRHWSGHIHGRREENLQRNSAWHKNCQYRLQHGLGGSPLCLEPLRYSNVNLSVFLCSDPWHPDQEKRLILLAELSAPWSSPLALRPHRIHTQACFICFDLFVKLCVADLVELLLMREVQKWSVLLESSSLYLFFDDSIITQSHQVSIELSHLTALCNFRFSMRKRGFADSGQSACARARGEPMSRLLFFCLDRSSYESNCGSQQTQKAGLGPAFHLVDAGRTRSGTARRSTVSSILY